MCVVYTHTHTYGYIASTIQLNNQLPSAAAEQAEVLYTQRRLVAFSWDNETML